jgi:hypothetical protein
MKGRAHHHKSKFFDPPPSECGLPFEERVVLLHAAIADEQVPTIGGKEGFEWEDLVACGYARNLEYERKAGGIEIGKKRYTLTMPIDHPGCVSYKGALVTSSPSLRKL